MNLFDVAMLAPNISELIDSTSEGDYNQLDGLQSGVPFSEVVVHGKNLIKYPYDNTTKTVNGITFTDNGDGSVTVNGTATEGVAFYFIHKKVPTFPIDRTYFLSGCPVGGSNSTFDLFFASFNANGDIVDICDGDTGNGTVVNMSENVTAINIYIRVKKGVTVDNLIFRPMFEVGETATEYAPPITGRELTLAVCGKNLFHCDGLSTFTKNGIAFTVNGDGTYTLNGTATDSASFSTRVDNIKHSMKIGETYTFKALPDGYINNNNEFCYLFTYSETGGSIKDFVTDENGRGETFTLTACNVITFGLNIPSGTVFNNLVIKPQLELGSTATPYEPYSGADYTITPDSNPYTVPTEIYQQNGINTVCVTGEGEPKLSVTGVKKNAAVKKIWDKLLELETAIIVSNGEI